MLQCSKKGGLKKHMNGKLTSSKEMKLFYKSFSETVYSGKAVHKIIALFSAIAASAFLLIPYSELNNELVVPAAAVSLYAIAVITYMQPFVYLPGRIRVEEVFRYTPASPEDYCKRNIVRLLAVCLILLPVMMLFQLASGFSGIFSEAPLSYSTDSLSVIYPLIICLLTFMAGVLYVANNSVRRFALPAAAAIVILGVLLLPADIDIRVSDNSEHGLYIELACPHGEGSTATGYDFERKIYLLEKGSESFEEIQEVLSSVSFHRSLSTFKEADDSWYLSFLSFERNGEYIPNLTIYDSEGRALFISADYFQYRLKQYEIYGGEAERLRIIGEISSVLNGLTPEDEYIY